MTDRSKGTDVGVNTCGLGRVSLLRKERSSFVEPLHPDRRGVTCETRSTPFLMVAGLGISKKN